MKTKLFLRSIFSTFATLEISKQKEVVWCGLRWGLMMCEAYKVWMLRSILAWQLKPCLGWNGQILRVFTDMCFTIFLYWNWKKTYIGTGTCVFFVKMPPIDLTQTIGQRSDVPGGLFGDPNPSWNDVQCSRETMTVSNEEKLGSYSRNRPNSHNHPTNRCHLGKPNMIQI